MPVEIRKGKTVEASGDTVEEALWELKRNHKGDHIYPVHESLGSSRVVGVHIRPAKDEMKVIELTVVES